MIANTAAGRSRTLASGAKSIFQRLLETVFFRKLIFWRISSQRNQVALTFDDGPHPDITPRILNILKESGVRATFFVIGQEARKYPEIVRRIVEDGHVVGCHTE